MNKPMSLKKYELWSEFENLIANELNSEKNLRDKQALFQFLDNKIEEIQFLSKKMEQFSDSDESLLIIQYEKLKELITKLQLLKDSMNHPFVLYVMGMGKVGKSTLLNLLVGSHVAEVGALPKTWKTDFFYATQQSEDVVVKHRDGSEKRLSIDEAKKLIAKEEEKREDSEDKIDEQYNILSKELTLIEDKTKLKEELSDKLLYRSDIKEMQWGLEGLPDHSILHQFSIVDTPGLWQNHHGTHGENIGDFYHQADGILWLLDSNTISSNKPKQVLDQLSESLKHVGQQSRNMLAVLNRIDKVRQNGGEEAVNGVVNAAKEIFDGRFLDVLPCSATDAIKAQKHEDQQLLHNSGYPFLLNRIQKHFYENAFSLRIEGKLHSFVGVLETYRQENEPFLQKLKADIEIFDEYKAKIKSDLTRFEKQYSKDWESCFNNYKQRVNSNISTFAKDYVDLQDDNAKSRFVQNTIFQVSELENITKNFQKEKSLALVSYIRQQDRKIAKSFERYSMLSRLKPALLAQANSSLSLYQSTSIDFSSSEVEGVLVGGAAAGVAMLLLGPVGLIAGAIGFFWSQSRKVDKAKEGFRDQLAKIENDFQNNNKVFLEKIFKQQQQNISNSLDKAFSSLYTHRKNTNDILNIFDHLTKMKEDSFEKVTFQDFIFGAKK